MGRPFADVLRDLAGGKTYEEAGSELANVVQAVMETGKVGSLTLTLKIKPNGEHSVIMTDSITARVPQGNRGETLFYATSGGSLVREDPRQEKLPLRQVEGTRPGHTGTEG